MPYTFNPFTNRLDFYKTSSGPPGVTTSLSPYIVGPTESDFTDIQPAIDAAVLAGYNNSNPINIYIKPSNATYVNSITMADGINLVAFGYAFNSVNGSQEPNSVRIYANVTFPTNITASMSGIDFVNQNIEQQGGSMFLQNCNLTGNATIFYSGTDTKNTIMNECYGYGGISLFSTSGDVQLINISMNYCASDKTMTSTFDANATLQLSLYNYQFTDKYVISGDSNVITLETILDNIHSSPSTPVVGSLPTCHTVPTE